jgi:hypothetical protein
VAPNAMHPVEGDYIPLLLVERGKNPIFYTLLGHLTNYKNIQTIKNK